mgnify:CR=1 FL=1
MSNRKVKPSTPPAPSATEPTAGNTTPTTSGDNTMKKSQENSNNTEESQAAGENVPQTPQNTMQEEYDKRLKNLEYAVNRILEFFDKASKQNQTPTAAQPSPAAQTLMQQSAQPTNLAQKISMEQVKENIPYIMMGIGQTIGNNVMESLTGQSAGGFQKLMQEKMVAAFMEDLSLATDIRKALKSRLVGEIVTKTITTSPSPQQTGDEHQVGTTTTS